MRRHGFGWVLSLACLTWLLLGAELAGAQAGSVPGQQMTVSVASLKVPAKAWQHYNRAVAAEKSNSAEACDRELAKALEISPDFAEAHLLRASRAIDARRFDAALEDLLKAQQLNPRLPWIGLIFAEYYNGVRRYKDAWLVLQNLPGTEPDSWQAKYETAFAEVGMGHGEAAVHWSEAALAQAPATLRETHLMHAYALDLMHRWSEAEVELERYLAAPGPVDNRKDVLATLAYTQRMAAREQAGQTVASR